MEVFGKIFLSCFSYSLQLAKFPLEKTHATCIGCLFASLISPVQAAFTDFSDYTQTREFALGEEFASKGLFFKAVESGFRDYRPKIVESNGYSFLVPGPGVEFLLPPNVKEVNLTYDGPGYLIVINGQVAASGPTYQTLFDELNGTTLGGVMITTFRDIPPPMGPGYLTLRGSINSLMIAGIELIIDDITVRVPEPSTMVIFFVAIVPAMLRRRKLVSNSH